MDFNKLIPELSVRDFEKSIEFYKALGFKIEYERQKFAMISLEGSQVMIEEINDNWNTGKLEYPFGRGINFQIEVKSIEPILEKLSEIAYPLFKSPRVKWYRENDRLWGNREFLVQDPDGYLLRFAEDLGVRKA